MRFIERRRALAEQFRQLARRHAAQQIHLEEALLRVHETGGVGHVAATAAADERHACASRATLAVVSRPAAWREPSSCASCRANTATLRLSPTTAKPLRRSAPAWTTPSPGSSAYHPRFQNH
jgi:hypothetical protein